MQKRHWSELGIFSSENFRGNLLLLLAIYCVYKGYSPKDIQDMGSTILAKWQQYQDTIVSITAIVAALIDNLHYTKRRTDLKISSKKK